MKIFDFSSLQQSSMAGKSAIYVDYFHLFPAISSLIYGGDFPAHV
jgi:hypothetical protein